MKSQAPALTKAALVSIAERKAHKVQRKLSKAESELHTANKVLKAAPAGTRTDMEGAIEQSVAAEEKVHEAAEELEVVKELLNHANNDSTAGQKAGNASLGQTGDGLKSLMSHLAPRGSAAQ